MPTITALPTAPSRSTTPAVFVTQADAWVAALAVFVTETNALAAYLQGLTGSSGPIVSTSLTMTTARLLGRTTAATGAIEELSASQVATLIGLLRLVSFFFTTTPTASEVLALYVAADAFTLPANLSGSQVKVGTNATATFALDLQQNGTSIGTISIATSGTATLTTTSGAAKSIAAGDVLKVVAPGTVDATIANVAINLKGTL
jgi:hypothetical protein